MSENTRELLNEYIDWCDKLKEEVKQLKAEKEDYCFACDVAERMRKVTYAATGGRLSYANYTVEAIEQAYHDQLCHDVEARTKELQDELDQLKAENEKLKQALEQIKKVEKDMCILCREQYYNQHCEECNTVLVLDIINKIPDFQSGRVKLCIKAKEQE